MSERTREDLKRLQEKSLEEKILLTKARVREWVSGWGGEDHVCVSFSGGKDSTVLLHLVRSTYPNVKAVYSDTGLEFPEIKAFVRTFDNVDIVRPKMRFDEVITKYGYPIVSKEVAEAIHYARRITYSQNVQVERERERERERRTQSERNCAAKENGDARRAYINRGGQQTECHSQGRTHQRRRCLNGEERMQAGVSGKTVEGGAFSEAESFGEKSLFNKEKWLPLAKDAPFLISHMCCKEMKKSPLRIYQRANKVKPFLGTLAEESRIRRQAWMRHGCNAFDTSEPQSTPLSFWTTQDILEYIIRYGKEIASVYGDIVCVDEDGNEYDPHGTFAMGNLTTTGEDQTGCIFCMFGAHLDTKHRFVRLKQTHPKLYDYCMRGGQWSPNPYYRPDAPEYDGEWKNWNPEKIWTPGNGGLGMAKVIDIFNEMYPKNRIEY